MRHYAALIVFALAFATRAETPFGASLDLSDIDGVNGFVIDGHVDFSQFCRSLNRAGDFNGDGVADFITGSSLDNVRVIFGGAHLAGRTPLDLAQLAPHEGVVLTSTTPNALIGYAVGSAGDFNGDGVDDVMVASNNDGWCCYVVYGAKEIGQRGTIILDEMTPHEGFRITYEFATNWFAYAMDGGGDVNNDGYDDLLFSDTHVSWQGVQRGGVFVVYGGPDAVPSGQLELLDLDGDNGFVIVELSEALYLGASVRYTGDLNADGYDDMLLGSPGGAAAYVVYGGKDIGGYGFVYINRFTPSDGFTIRGYSGLDYPMSAGAGGDLNGDGYLDLAIGDIYEHVDGRPGAGAVRVLFGGPDMSGDGVVDLEAPGTYSGFEITGVGRGDFVGASADIAGDLNGDGFADLLVRSPQRHDEALLRLPAAVWVVFGGTHMVSGGSLSVEDIDGGNGVRLNHEVDHLNLTDAVFVGDINNDGYDDLVAGAYNLWLDKPDIPPGAGRAYAVFGWQEPEGLAADFTSDGCVDGLDLAALLAGWRESWLDLSGDDVVLAYDLSILLAAWGNGCD